MIGVIAVACSSFGATARADGLALGSTPSVLVIATEAKPGSAEADVIDAVRDALAELREVKLLPPAPLDLDAVQLAIDCTDESARCLGEIATRMEAQIVVIPSLRKRADALELQIKCFKQGAPGGAIAAMRKQAGTRLDATLLDTVPSMLREVLELTVAEEEATELEQPVLPEPERATEEEEHAASTRPASTIFGLPLGPVLLGGGGLTLLAAGLVVGAMASSSEDDYASRPIDTVEQAKQADAVRETGEREALIANVLLGTGAAAVIAAGVWYAIDGSTEGAPAHATLRPVLGRQSAGLVFSGRFQVQP